MRLPELFCSSCHWWISNKVSSLIKFLPLGTHCDQKPHQIFTLLSTGSLHWTFVPLSPISLSRRIRRSPYNHPASSAFGPVCRFRHLKSPRIFACYLVCSRCSLATCLLSFIATTPYRLNGQALLRSRQDSKEYAIIPHAVDVHVRVIIFHGQNVPLIQCMFD